MKGFPNQVAELGKLAKAMQCVVQVLGAGQRARDDGILGQAFVRSGVAGTGHRPMPVDQYIRQQLTKAKSEQSFRTTARGLRELFKYLGFIREAGDDIEVTELGKQAAAFADQAMSPEQLAFWRRTILAMTHFGDDATSSHPYQVLLRLVAQKPGITRAKCALALEARDDSQAELDRIVGLVDLPEPEIIRRIGITKSNWDNAKKILPKFAEQLGDVVRDGDSFRIADAPGTAGAGAAAQAVAPPRRPARPAAPRAPRTARAVTPNTIGRAGTVETFDEVGIRPVADPAATAAARLERLRRHNLLVQRLAARLDGAHAELYEDPFDVLAIIQAVGVLAEIKTLDGTVEDERERVRAALAQLLYYSAFLTNPAGNATEIRLIACFERQITDAHARWLNAQRIGVIWENAGRFAGDELARRLLGEFLEELR